MRPPNNMLFLLALLITTAASISAQVQHPSGLSDAEMLLTVRQVFKVAEVDLDLYLKVRREMDAMKEVGLDTLMPARGAGVTVEWVNKGDHAFNQFNAMLRLIATGVSKERAFTALACARKNKRIIGEMDYPELLLCALRETGQDIDSLLVVKAAKEALYLKFKTGSGSTAYKAAGIDIKRIPPAPKTKNLSPSKHD